MAKNSSVKQGKKGVQASTQIHLPISEIHDDLVVLKNGGLRGIIRTSSINFNLKSEEEQNSILYSYQGFLNTLEFPIQIVIRSKKLDIDIYLEKLQKIGERQENTLLQQQTFEYIDYIQKLVEYADIMEKDFLVVVPYDPFRSQKKNMFQEFFKSFQGKETYSEIKRKHKEFEELRKGLNQRINIVKIGLENCGLKAKQLNNKELVDLFYNSFNPLTARNQKVKDIDEIDIKNDSVQRTEDTL